MTNDSFEVRGPYHSGPREWMYELLDDGEIIADVRHKNQAVALERAILLAAAPRMKSVLDVMVGVIRTEPPIAAEPSHLGVSADEICNAFVESEGMPCAACDSPGQPSRMTWSPDNRLYHATCLPADVKAAIAAEEAAAAEEMAGDDVPY